jgi:putative hydrolase of HD superfamily
MMDILTNILKYIDKMKSTLRHSYTKDGRVEDVAAHTWGAMFMAMLYAPDHLDMKRVYELLLIHDLGESVCGDVPFFEKTERDDDRENKAMEGIIYEDMGPYGSKIQMLWEEYIEQETEESKFVNFCDKLDGNTQHIHTPVHKWRLVELDNCATVRVEEAARYSEYTIALAEAVSHLYIKRIEEVKKEINK